MSEETVIVNKRGQFTIPSRFRRSLGIREGTKLLLTQDESAITVRRLLEIDDLLGLHSGKVTFIELQSDPRSNAKAGQILKVKENW